MIFYSNPPYFLLQLCCTLFAITITAMLVDYYLKKVIVHYNFYEEDVQDYLEIFYKNGVYCSYRRYKAGQWFNEQKNEYVSGNELKFIKNLLND